MTAKEMDRFNINDEYDINVFVGKIIADYDVSPQIKDAIKEVAREAFKIGYQTAKEEE